MINSSSGNLEPMFASMLEKAVRICDARYGNVYRWDGFAFHLVATHNTPIAFAEARKRSPPRPSPNNLFGRVVASKMVLHIDDASAEDREQFSPESPYHVAAVELGHVKTILAVPLLKENELVGFLSLIRQEVKPFSEKQIALVTNFAAQAVIAIENARLLNELRQRTTDLTEALEQQTATSNVLQVISSFPGNLEPVFATMLENAVRLCDAKFGSINRWDGEALHLVGTYNVPPAFAEFRKRTPFRPGPENPISRMLMTKTVIHFHDLATEQGYIERNPTFVAAVELGGVRTFLAVPMLKENELIGVVIVYRQEVRPFSDKQIVVVNGFAAQAVIAIENARLLGELRQSLEQQTATSEVLQVISSSPGDLRPVFASALENATRICEANFGVLMLYESAAFQVAATHNAPPAFVALRQRQPTIRASGALERVVAAKRLLQISDCLGDASYKRGDADFVRFVDLCRVRSLILAPMLKEAELIGVIGIYRPEVRPFTDRQIELLANFAAQAVIAIENARLLNELRQRTDDLTERTEDLTEALEQQTATSEVLQSSVAPQAIWSQCSRQCWRTLSASATPRSAISTTGTVRLCIFLRRIIRRLLSRKRAGVRLVIQMRMSPQAEWQLPKRWFTSPILRQSRRTLDNAIQQRLKPLNLAACGHFWLSLC